MTAGLSKGGAIVIGGGVAGLTAARDLSIGGFAPVTVVEASPRLGGKLDSIRLESGGQEIVLDSGAESVLARRPEAVTLMAELGLRDRMVHPTPAKAQVLLGGEVRRLPPQLMGVPTDLDALAGYLTPAGVARARQEPELPAPALEGDIGIGRYVAVRFGDEVTDRLLEPMLGGVYAGRSRELSFEAVSPALYERARGGGSLLGHARSLLPAPSVASTPQPVFAGLVGGVSTLIEALATDLRARGVVIEMSATARELKVGDGGFEVTIGPVPAPRQILADAVVVAAPAAPASRLLSGALGSSAELLADIPYASMAVITFVVSGAELQGSGLLVPPGESPTIKALTYSSNKWNWVAERAAERWGTGTAIVRASVGRIGEEALLQVDDDALLKRSWEEASGLPGWDGAKLITGAVTRWGGGLPQYLVGHTARIAELSESVDQVRGLAICGAALAGVGIAACVASGRAAATKINNETR